MPIEKDSLRLIIGTVKMLYLFFILPAFAGTAAFFIRSSIVLRWLMLSCSVIHTGLLILALFFRDIFEGGNWIGLDAPGLFFLLITSILFLGASLYSQGQTEEEIEADNEEDETYGALISSEPESVFIGSILFFLSCMSLLSISRHMGLIWVALEGTTLATAPLIFYHRQPSSIEATWKYLLVCSVGISLGLLGNFFLSVAASSRANESVPLFIDKLLQNASALDKVWLKAAFILFMVGYGTKMGLAPMHTWLPDAHSEAPPAASALLSGTLLNCAFFALARTHQIMAAAGESIFSQKLFIFFGLFSMLVASIFILSQKNYKRLLAYSSIENMGIIALGFGLGGIGAFAAILHALLHSLSKSALFFASGNILRIFGSKSSDQVSGLLKLSPKNGLLWIAGFLAITGSPPFGTFFSEIFILKSALFKGFVVTILYLFALIIVFVGMAKVFLGMALGELREEEGLRIRNIKISSSCIIPPALFLFLVFLFSFWIPTPVFNLIRETAETLGGIK